MDGIAEIQVRRQRGEVRGAWAGRGAEAATAAILRRLLPAHEAALTPLAEPVLRNWNGVAVGRVRPVEALA